MGLMRISAMRIRSDPYLWIHAAGLAVVPIALLLCWLGLAVGDPALPMGVELGLVAIVGIAPVVWMQLQKPFYIFSLVAVALKPEKLTDDQRRILTLFKTRTRLIWVGLGSLFLFLLLRQIYLIAPIASEFAPLAPSLRVLGLGWAAITFLASNLFLQVPLSVIQVLLTSDQQFAATQPYSTEQISQSFSIFGLRVNQLVPPLKAEESSLVAETLAPPVDGSAIASETRSESDSLTIEQNQS
jgi:hypothetical protein